MASDEAPGKENAAVRKGRFFGGPRAIGALLPAVTRPAFRARSAAAAHMMADWTEIVGPTLGAATFPRQLAQGTLTISCAGPVALELQHLTGPLAERINAYFGRVVVQRFRFIQGEVVAAKPLSPARRRVRPPVDIPDMKEGGLRDALAALGAAIAGER